MVVLLAPKTLSGETKKTSQDKGGKQELENKGAVEEHSNCRFSKSTPGQDQTGELTGQNLRESLPSRTMS